LYAPLALHLLGHCFTYLLVHLHWISGLDQIVRTFGTAFAGTLLHVFAGASSLDFWTGPDCTHHLHCICWDIASRICWCIFIGFLDWIRLYAPLALHLLGHCFMYLLVHLHWISGLDQIMRTTCTAFTGTLLHAVHLRRAYVNHAGIQVTYVRDCTRAPFCVQGICEPYGHAVQGSRRSPTFAIARVGIYVCRAHVNQVDRRCRTRPLSPYISVGHTFLFAGHM
jgi:hypothetical protein